MRLAAPVEIREAEGGPHLYGVLIQEGRAARRRREVFAPGSVEWPADGVGILSRHHGAPIARAVPSREPDGRITIRTRATDAIRAAVEGGRKFMSVEFHALRERRTEGGIREILRALVRDVALVASPEYDMTRAEVRQQERMKTKVPRSLGLQCRCGPGDCEEAVIEGVDVSEDVLGYLGDYSKPLGEATATATDEAVAVVIDVVAGTSYGDDMVAMMRGGIAPIIRPYPDPVRSVTRKEGRVLVYEKLVPAGWIATFTDQTGGFTPASLEENREKSPQSGFPRAPGGRGRGESPEHASASASPSRRRVWL